jgi:hypothetical protein
MQVILLKFNICAEKDQLSFGLSHQLLTRYLGG